MTADVCPECGAIVKFGYDTDSGERIAYCPDCDWEMRVTSLAR